MFGRRKERAVIAQSSPEEWRQQWQALVPPECRNVPVTVGEKTEIAFVQENHFPRHDAAGRALMERSFFDVRALSAGGGHVIWPMRCTQDIRNGLRRREGTADGASSGTGGTSTTNSRPLDVG